MSRRSFFKSIAGGLFGAIVSSGLEAKHPISPMSKCQQAYIKLEASTYCSAGSITDMTCSAPVFFAQENE